MNSNRRTQAERSAATRDALIAAGRALFGARGYADVGTEEVVRAAGVTRGALYHHFADKAELFGAVFQSVEETANARIMAAVTAAGPDDPIAAMKLATAAFLDVCAEPGTARIMFVDAPAVFQSVEEMANARIMAAVTAAGPDDPIAAMKLATAAFLDVCAEPGTARIMFVDAPAVFGVQDWSEASESDLSLVVQLITRGIELGRIPPQPALPLARILNGALREAVLFLASAPDPAAARAQVGAVLDGIIESITVGGER